MANSKNISTLIKICVFILTLSFLYLILSFYILHDTKTGVVSTLKNFEKSFFSSRSLTSFGSSPPPQDILFIDIDQSSIKEIGPWPWRRSKLISVINRISKFKPKLIAIDLDFNKKDRRKRNDIRLKNLLYNISVKQNIPIIIPYQLTDLKKDSFKRTPRAVKKSLLEFKPKGFESKDYYVSKYGYPNKRIQHYSHNMGFQESLIDKDGFVRKYPLMRKGKDGFFPSFALSVAHLLYPESIGLSHGVTNYTLKLNKKRLNLDKNMNLELIYHLKPDHIPTISFKEMDDKKTPFEENEIKDKIVILGSTAPEVSKTLNTPLSPVLSSTVVEITAANMVLKGLTILPPIANCLATFCITLLGLFMFNFLQRKEAFISTILYLGLFALIVTVIDVLLLTKVGFQIALLFSYSYLFLLYFLMLIKNNFSANENTRYLKETFSKYVSPAIVSEITNRRDEVSLFGVNREITCLFLDIVGFTALSNKLQPNQIVSILNFYIEFVSEHVFHYNGTLDKVVGDGIIAYWGAPLKTTDHAIQALRCSIDIIAKQDILNETLIRHRLPPIEISGGLNTGICLVGSIGRGKTLSYTAIGSTMNIGSRIEKYSRKVDHNLLFTESTAQKLSDFQRAELDIVKIGSDILRGEDIETGIYAIKGL